ncbi:hypothetical protein PG994_006581 [Apiospora phragmitis]|uniref:Uncharacterized protein n=1 Tax=Apiospora phragmitis TaxID=2905665 RepID=A0ABR1VIA2_9PEZI
MANQSGPSLSMLELLLPELLEIILAATGLDDLHAFIRASPTLYRVFCQTKASIILKVCANDLGPAIRDAIILASVGYAREDEAVAAWKDRLLSRKDRWLKGVSTDEALTGIVVTINRTVQYFVDFYTRSRFTRFEKRLGGQPKDACTGTLSATERENLSQAFVRRQAIVNMYRLSLDTRPAQAGSELAVIDHILALFEPWEKEQIAQVDSFVYDLCIALQACEKTYEEGVPRMQIWQRQYGEYYPQLPALRRKMTQAAAADAELMNRILASRPFRGSDSMTWVGKTAWKFLRDSHWQPNPSTSPLPPSGPPVPCNLTSQSPVEPPWGWLDAVGHTGNRWGDELYVKLPLFANRHAWILNSLKREDFDRWRWAGFVFWDRSRVKILNRGLLDHVTTSTGWLANLYE